MVWNNTVLGSAVTGTSWWTSFICFMEEMDKISEMKLPTPGPALWRRNSLRM